MAYTKYSLTPADNNAAPPNGAPEGMLPSAVNDTMRDMMAQIRDVGDGIRGGTYTMTAPVITGGSITGVALSGNTLTNPVITGGSINNTPIGATTASTGKFTTLTNAALTSGRVTYAGTSGVLQDDADFTFNGTTVTMANDASISGLRVGQGNTVGSANTAFGLSALNVNTGAYNTAIGYESLIANTTGANNTSLGFYSLRSNTTASNNTALGNQAMQLNTTGATNTAVGSLALYSNTTASNNTAVGYQSLYANTTGTSNVAVGSNDAGGTATMRFNTTGNYNSAFGGGALQANTTGSNNTALGYQALPQNTTASNNTAVGYQAGYSNTTGALNIAIGVQAGYTNTTGEYAALGYQALYNNTTGSNNAAFGRYRPLFNNTTGQDNSAFGDRPLYTNSTGSYNTAIGSNALYSNQTASNNTAVGYQAGYSNTTGTYNTYVGRGAGYSTTTGSGNTFIGVASLTGEGAGYQVTTGSDNTIIGGYNGNQGGLDIRTASNYIVLSDGDGNPRLIGDGSGNFGIGQVTEANSRLVILGTNNSKIQANHNSSTGQSFFSNGYSAAGTGWNHFNGVSGNNSVQNILIYGNGNIVNANGVYGTISDIKFKENIVDATPKLEKLLQIRVCNYNLKGDYEQHKQLGVVAQELEQVFPGLVEEISDKDTDGNEIGTTTKSVKYSVFVPMLIKAMQELNEKVEAQALEIKQLKGAK
jgi:trimeric autotransporter adhesin